MEGDRLDVSSGDVRFQIREEIERRRKCNNNITRRRREKHVANKLLLKLLYLPSKLRKVRQIDCKNKI